MNYEKKIRFNGEFTKVFDIAKTTFLPHGFKISKHTDECMEFSGAGNYWTTNQDPLVGVSQLLITENHGELSIKAEFGGIRKTMAYLILFLASMIVFFMVLFYFLFREGTLTQRFLLPLAPFFPWPVIMPLMAKWMKMRTSRSLDVFIDNAVSLA